MNKLSFLLSLAMMFTLSNASMGNSTTEITLTANQVTSAIDIEQAVDAATNYGTHAGTVTLDSTMGSFTYSGEDRSINIYYSNITLRSKNRAQIANCGDGVYFDNTETNNISIAGIEFDCESTGVNASGAGIHRNVIIKDNVFRTQGPAIEVQHADGWNITGNRAAGNGASFHLLDTSEARITGNFLVTHTDGSGIFLERTTTTMVKQNMIFNVSEGILIGLGSTSNRITDNSIYMVRVAGITFAGSNEYNIVQANKVNCQPDMDCAILSITNPPLSSTNRVLGNKFVR